MTTMLTGMMFEFATACSPAAGKLTLMCLAAYLGSTLAILTHTKPAEPGFLVTQVCGGKNKSRAVLSWPLVTCLPQYSPVAAIYVIPQVVTSQHECGVAEPKSSQVGIHKKIAASTRL